MKNNGKGKPLSLACIFLALALLLCACGGGGTKVYYISGEDAWAAFPVDEAPVKTVRAGEKWYSLIGEYLGESFALSVSDDYMQINEVYKTSGVSIWFFEADGSGAAWCERGESTLRFMFYPCEGGDAEEIAVLDTSAGFNPANVGLFGGGVYFVSIDHAAKRAAVMRYDTEAGTLSRFFELEYRGDYTCTSLSADGGSLLISAGAEGEAELIKLDLAGGGQERIALSESVNFVFACAYDSAEGGFAIYYSDTAGGEHIGTVNAKNGKVKNVSTFGASVYAYQDVLEFYGGHLYWVQQINASGNVAEHYRFVDHNCKNNSTEEYLKTFSFSLAEDGVTLLAFNEVDYDAIYLTEIYLGGNEK